MTPYQRHAERWKECTACSLFRGRTQVVLGKGTLPATVCFVGEAPGASEDGLGDPFSGPAGHLLDRIVERSLEQWQPPTDVRKRFGSIMRYNSLSCAYTNLVACFPREQKKSGDNAPPAESIEACGDRLRGFVAMAKPKLIVAVGSLAEKWVPKVLGGNVIDGALVDGDEVDGELMCKFIGITHPAFILSKMNPAMQGLAVQRCMVAISDAVEELFQ